MLLIILSMLLLTIGRALSSPYNDVPDWVESWDSGITMDVCLFDVDNDNDLDAVTAQYDYENGARLLLYLNENGALSLIPEWSSSTVACFECITVGDMNNNGFMDVIAGTVNRIPGDGHNYVFYNNEGTLSHTPGWISDDTKDTFTIQAVDIDRDGRLELLTGNQSFRLLFYDNDDSGLATAPSDVFQVCSNMSASISKFNGITGADEGVQMLAAWDYNSDRIPQKPWTQLYNLESFGSLYPPNTIWSAEEEEYYCDCRFFLASDLNGDGDTDWLGNSGSNLWKGICSQGVFDVPRVSLLLPCTENQDYDPVYRIYLANIEDYSNLDGGAEIIVAAPGIVDPFSPESNRTMLHAANLIYSVDDWTEASPTVTPRWSSSIDSRSTTSISIGDINSDGVALVVETVLQTASNQSYLINDGLPIEYVGSVTVNGIPCLHHCDRSKGLLSLVKDLPVGTISADVQIEYYVSDKQDLFCGMVGQNVVYYHKAI